MADLTLTATSVVAGANSKQEHGVAGETITAGQTLYLSSSTGKWMKSNNKSVTPEARPTKGIALNGASINQSVSVHTDGDITIGATLTPGTAYYGSDTAGGICPVADLTSGEYVCLLGIAKSATVLAFKPQYPGVAI